MDGYAHPRSYEFALLRLHEDAEMRKRVMKKPRKYGDTEMSSSAETRSHELHRKGNLAA